MSDSAAINSLLGDDDREGLDASFSSSSKQTLSDINGGSYTRDIRFTTQSLINSWTLIDMLELTLNIKGSAAFSANPLFAVKASILSLFKGIQIKTGNGTMILNETEGLEFTNHLAMMLENSNDWAVSNGAQLYWAKDRAFDHVFSGLTTKAAIANPKTAPFTGAVSATTNTFNDKYNVGFVERNRALLDSAISDDGTYISDKSAGFNINVYIPLKYIHPFFASLDFPITNTVLQIDFLLNTAGSNSNYNPFCFGTLPAGTVETGGNVIATIAAGTQCRLHYRIVQFHGKEGALVAAKLKGEGFKKTIRYSSFSMNRMFNNIASTSRFEHAVTSGITNPHRVWLLTPPAGVVDGSTWPSPIMTGPYGVTNLNVRINGTPQYTVDLNSFAQLWDELKKTMPPSVAGQDTSSQLTFSDFLKTHRIHCLDISRYQHRVNGDVNARVEIVVTGNPTSTTPVDFIYLVEREIECVIHFGPSAVLVAPGF